MCPQAFWSVTFTTLTESSSICFTRLLRLRETLVINAVEHGCPVTDCSCFYLLDKVSFVPLLVLEFIKPLSLIYLFLCSLDNVCGQEKVQSDNFTRILDELLNGYDNRLRPGSGGNSYRKSLNTLSIQYIYQDCCCAFCVHLIVTDYCYRWSHRGENRHFCHQLWTCFWCWYGKIILLYGDVHMCWLW